MRSYSDFSNMVNDECGVKLEVEELGEPNSDRDNK
jgi:hypothetical protein